MINTKLQWGQFDACNPNQTDAFETMCRRLFFREFMKRKERPHTDHNTPGVEVLPILEPERDDGQPRKWISFQAKYVSQPAYAYPKFKESAKTTAKKHKGKLDLVYLFCNKTLTSTAAPYREIERIHAEAGIETRLITGPDLLDMIADYAEIAECFFCENSSTNVIYNGTNNFNGITINNIDGNITITTISGVDKPENTELLKKLVNEKLIECRKLALDFELTVFKDEVEKLISFGVDGIDEAEVLYFYKFLLLLREGKDTADVCVKCSKEYKNDVDWMLGFYGKPETLTFDEFEKQSSIVQLFIIDRLFKPGHWKKIIDLYEKNKESAKPEIQKQLTFYYSLSLMNLQDNEKAAGVFDSLFAETHEQKMDFFATMARIRVENNLYQRGLAGHCDILQKLLEKLDSFKTIPQYKLQELYVDVHIIESYYHLGTEDKKYLEIAIDFEELLPEEIKKHSAIRFYFALCLELSGRRKEAEETYASLDWKTNESIAIRYLICLRLNNKSEEAVRVYEALDDRIKTIETEALYLFALEKADLSLHKTKLKEACDKYKNDLAALLAISYFEENKKVIKSIIVPPLKEGIKVGAIHSLQTYQQAELLTLLAHIEEVELLRNVLATIEDVSLINNFTVREIYKSLVVICNDKRVFGGDKFELSKKGAAVEQIADIFLAKDTQRRLFLQIKAFCVNTKKMPFSMLKCSEELFNLTHDITWAKNVVGLLIDRNETSIDRYKPYIDALKSTDIPDCCMAVAMAYLLCGQENTAESFAYKAIYLLNGEDDYNIYRLYFGFGNYKYRWISNDQTFSTENKVIMLQDDNGEQVCICLDSEMDFTFEGNHSMGLIHMNPTETNYLKLKRASLQQRVHIGDNTYTVKEIIPRFQQCMRFVFGKMQANPDKFPGAFVYVSTEHPEDAIEEIKRITDRSEHIEQRLQNYHFKNNPGGLPIECVGFNDYDKYIDILRYLLFTDDQALYTGQTIFDDFGNRKIVISMPTLVLLGIMGMMDCLYQINDRIIIPDSYIHFFQERYDRALLDQQNNVKTLWFPNGKPYIQEHDESISDIWGNCIDLCKSCKTEIISDTERIELEVCENITGERLISSFCLDSIQLDAIILAKREKALFICDDLFFRKIANNVGVKHYNFASLLIHYNDKEYRDNILLQLSRTNYTFLPFLAQSDEIAQEYYSNLMTGKIKKVLYGPQLQLFFEVREKIYRRIFGDDLIDQLLADAEETRAQE